MTPREFTKLMVEKHAKPIGDSARLMFWNWEGHAVRLLCQALAEVLGDDHPIGKLLLEYMRADMIASKVINISDDDAGDLDCCGANIESYADDLTTMIAEWRDGVEAMLNPEM